MIASARMPSVCGLSGLAVVLAVAAAAGTSPGDSVPAAPRADREGFPLPAEAVARVGSARLRHGRPCLGVDYSPDGTLLASSGGGVLKLWEARTGKLIRAIRTPDAAVSALGGPPDCVFSADGKTVVVLEGATCHWLDVRTGREVRPWHNPSPLNVYDAYFGPRGALLAVTTGAPDCELIVYDLVSGMERFRAASKGVWCWRAMNMRAGAAFAPNGKTLAAIEFAVEEGDAKLRVCLFATDTGKTLGTFDAGPCAIDLTFSADGTKLLVRNFDNKLTVWDVPAGKSPRQLKTHAVSLTSTAFTPDGRSVVVGSNDRDVVRIDLATGKEIGRFHTPPLPQSFAFAPDGKTLAVGCANGAVLQFDLATAKRRAASADPADGFWRPRFDADGKLLWLCSEAYTAVDPSTGRVVQRVPLPHRGGASGLFVSWDGSRAAGANADGESAVWDLATGKQLCALANCAPGSAMVFSRDGKTVYAVDEPGPVCVWDATTGKAMPTFDENMSAVSLLCLSPDGRRLVTVDTVPKFHQKRLTIWEPAGRRKLGQLVLPGISPTLSLAFSPDGRLLAVATYQTHPDTGDATGTVTLWNPVSGEKTTVASGVAAKMRAVAFSADGRTLVTGDAKGGVRLWEVATGRERHRFAGHECRVDEVAFSPDGKLVVSTGADAPAFIWDVEGRHGQPPSTVPFADGERARLWEALDDVDAAAAFAAVRQLLVRPVPAVALLRERLRPAAFDEKAVGVRLNALDADTFVVREKATAELEALADRAAPLLRHALAGQPAAEAKRRIERVLEAARTDGTQRRREVRAVEVLERLGTAEARELLAALARGAEGALLTREARSAAERLRAR